MTTDGDNVVIVGASVAGVHTARALRRQRFDGRIVLLSNESVMPYDKPPLSKGFLTGVTDPSQLALLTEDEAAELEVDIRLGCPARELYPADHRIELETGELVDYRRVVIATGAQPKHPPVWPASDRVHVVRTMSDAHRLRANLLRGGHLVVVGAGFIGAEVAATARLMGLRVTMVDPNPAPMTRIAGRHLGRRFVDLHHSHGVKTRFGVRVDDVREESDCVRIELSDRTTLIADACVIGIGAVPNDTWLATAGLRLDDGIVCDEHGKALGAADVFAVGDVARWYDPQRGRPVRHQHWTNAYEQAQVLAHNIVHPDDPIAHAAIEYVWTDQYDWKIRIAGTICPESVGAVEIISDETTDRYALLSSTPDGDSLSGIVVVNWPRALVAGRKALAQSTPYDNVKSAVQELLATSC